MTSNAEPDIPLHQRIRALVGTTPSPKERLQNRMRAAYVRASIREVIQGDVFDYVLLKGEPLAQELYGSSELRSTSDIDLLVRPDLVEPLGERLMSKGWTPKLPLRRLSTNQWVFFHPERAIVEIHWRLASPGLPAPSTGQLIREAVGHSLDDLTIPVLSPPWALIHLSYHFLQHGGFAKGLVDIAAWLDRYAEQVDPTEVQQRATAIGVTPMMRWPMKVIERLTGELPEPYRPWTRVEGTEDPLVEMTLSGLEDPARNPIRDLGKGSLFVFQTVCNAACVNGSSRRLSALCWPIVLGPHKIGSGLGRLVDGYLG